ncbi:protein-glutamine gamma-glutamyltransferase 2-like [Nematolebias whitei]|uniref:protein-glutamine gamma-glutamyltransferase 2-like n=1 Tax=Nematolebias whitei TaxID=451745 RepID=UPI00189890B2|nr:protein-glutamine gamma-glutamyltransferase 2-like [Nematolebias whitei]
MTGHVVFLVLSQLRKSYGNVHSLFLGPKQAVVINLLKAMKEAMVVKAMLLFRTCYGYDDELIKTIVWSFTALAKMTNEPNFHCWVETWMRRNDLSPGNDGWQALDPTPQELSEGEFCCGPSPVEAIKEGNLETKYDTRFTFAEVNADISNWMILPNGQRQKISVDERTVGRNISTKSVYGDFREDVTLQYKYPEGSAKEREVYLKAGRKILEPTESTKPKHMKLIIRHDQCVFGTDFDVTVEVKNEGEESVDVKLTMKVMAVSYNSIHQGDCLKQTSNVTVPAAQSHKEILRLQYENYARCVSDQHLIRVKVLAEAKGVPLPFMRVSDIPLKMPEIHIQIIGTTFVWEPVSANVSFTNPLPGPLNEGVFTLEGSGLLSDTHIYVTHAISPGEKVSVVVPFTPFKTGVRKLMANFDSDKLKGIKGEATVVIKSRHRNDFHVISDYY